MKKFIKFTLCLLLCVATLGLSACGGNKKEKVDTSVASRGNGGMVVTRGDYVYFVNGYNSYEFYSESNLDKKFTVGGLYRAKLNSDGELSYNEDGSVATAERISSDLVGFEYTSLYVFGNYIYYATPTTEVNKKGELQTSKLDFYRVKIGGGKAEQVYQSSSDGENVDFEFYYADGSVYLLVNDNGTLKRVNGYGKFSTSKIAEGVTSLALHRDTDNVFGSDSYKHVYYTKTNDDGNIEIYNYNVAANKNVYKKTTDYKTCELIDYRFGHLYYKASREAFPGYTYIYRMPATKNAITNLAEQQLTNDDSYTKFYFLDNETSGYLAENDSKTYYLTYSASGECEATPISTSKLDIMAIKDNYIYFKSGSDIKRINYYDFKVSGNKDEETIATVDGLATHGYDIDSNNIYAYAKTGNNTYLYSVYIGNAVEGEESEPKLLGTYLNGDAPKNDD